MPASICPAVINKSPFSYPPSSTLRVQLLQKIGFCLHLTQAFPILLKLGIPWMFM